MELTGTLGGTIFVEKRVSNLAGHISNQIILTSKNLNGKETVVRLNKPEALKLLSSITENVDKLI